MHRAIIRHHLGPRCNDPLVYDGQYRCDVQRQPIGFFDGFADSGGMGIDKEATARSRWWCCLTASLAVRQARRMSVDQFTPACKRGLPRARPRGSRAPGCELDARGNENHLLWRVARPGQIVYLNHNLHFNL